MGKARQGVGDSGAPAAALIPQSLLDVPVLDVPMAFFSSTQEGWCRLRVYAPPLERNGSPWMVWLSQEGDNDGWRFPEGTLVAARAAWQSLARLRHGDWPLPGDPRLDALPLHPGEIEWIESGRDHEGGRNGGSHQEPRRREFVWDGHTPRSR